MVKLRDIGNKAWQMSWSKLQMFSPDEQCYSLSERDINVLLTFVTVQASWSTRWGDYEDWDSVREYVAELASRLMIPSENCGGGCKHGNGCNCNGGSGLGFQNSLYEGENVSGIGIVRISGRAYLVQDCGCSDTAFFELTPVTASANGGLLSSGSGGGTDIPNGGFNYPAPSVDCYAGKAIPYLFGRAFEYAELIIDAAALGVDAVLGDLDEVFNGATLIADVLFGTNSTREIIQAGAGAFETAFSDTTVIAAFTESWTATGAVSRDGLKEWIARANTTYKIGGILPIKTYLTAWLNGSVVLGYNNELNKLAASCASGVDTSTPFPIFGQDADYIAFRVILDPPLDRVMQGTSPITIADIPFSYDLIWTIGDQITAGGGYGVQVKVDGADVATMNGLANVLVKTSDSDGAEAFLQSILGEPIVAPEFTTSVDPIPAGSLTYNLGAPENVLTYRLEEFYIVAKKPLQ